MPDSRSRTAVIFTIQSPPVFSDQAMSHAEATAKRSSMPYVLAKWGTSSDPRSRPGSNSSRGNSDDSDERGTVRISRS